MSREELEMTKGLENKALKKILVDLGVYFREKKGQHLFLTRRAGKRKRGSKTGLFHMGIHLNYRK